MSSSRCRRIIVSWSWRFVWNRYYMMMQTGNVGGEEVRGDEGVFSGMMFDRKGMKVIKMRRLSRDMLMREGTLGRGKKRGQWLSRP
jgi:hypothetical protein